MAEAIHDAFGDLSSEQGLTRAELAAACSAVASAEEFDSRFDIFVSLRLLERVRDKANDGRYVFNPTSGAALLVFERLEEAGGVEEILALLDRTRKELEDGTLSESQLMHKLRWARRDLSINTGYLLRLVRARPIEELLDQRRRHRSKAALLDLAQRLVGMVSRDFPHLRSAGTRLIHEALRYSAAVDEFYDRLLQQASTRRDFSMLAAEQYRSAALSAPVDKLAAVFATVVFDPPGLHVPAAQVLVAAQQRRPPVPRRRPARPATLPAGPDPVETARARARALRQRREAAIELLLQGQDEADLTQIVRALPWRAAITTLVNVLRAAADPQSPHFVEISPRVIVDGAGPVTYASPVTLFRVPEDASAVDEAAQRSPEEPA